MSAGRKIPIFGWGLSDMGYRFGDGHVGNQSLPAMTGVIGFFLFERIFNIFCLQVISNIPEARQNTMEQKLPPRCLSFFFLAGWFVIPFYQRAAV